MGQGHGPHRGDGSCAPPLPMCGRARSSKTQSGGRRQPRELGRRAPGWWVSVCGGRLAGAAASGRGLRVRESRKELCEPARARAGAMRGHWHHGAVCLDS